MLENMEKKPEDLTTILHSLISPDAFAVVLRLTDAEIVAVFAAASEKYGVTDSFMRASWRQTAARISRATSRKSSPRPKQSSVTPLESAIAATKKGTRNSHG